MASILARNTAEVWSVLNSGRAHQHYQSNSVMKYIACVRATV
jgi:hypothetical protein